MTPAKTQAGRGRGQVEEARGPVAPMVGRDDLRESLSAMLSSGRLPQVLLLAGPAGCGKQRLAHWLSQLLLCSDLDRAKEPCGECEGCRRVTRFTHPDLLWYGPHGSPGTGDKSVEFVRDSNSSRAQERTLGLVGSSEPGHAYYVASILALREDLALMPAISSRRVVVMAEVDRLENQAGATAAANMLLKTLEEPSPSTSFILTTSKPHNVLGTIRSRATLLRIPPLPVSVGGEILASAGHRSPDDVRKAFRQARGDLSRAHQALTRGLPERDMAKELLNAILVQDDDYGRSNSILRQGTSGAKAGFYETLVEALDLTADLLFAASGRDARVADPEWVQSIQATPGLGSPSLYARITTLLEQALSEARGNGVPILVAHNLACGTRQVLGQHDR